MRIALTEQPRTARPRGVLGAPAYAWPPELYALGLAVGPVTPAAWPRCERLLARLRAAAPLPVTLLVVPTGDEADGRTPVWYRQALTDCVRQGNELAWLSGGPVRGDAPRVAGADAPEREASAAARFAAGAVWFWSHGWRVHGFFPTNEAVAEPAWGALTGGLLRYTVVGDELRLLGTTVCVDAPRADLGLARAWSRRLAGSPPGGIAPDAPLARVVLAPDDVARPRRLMRAQRLVDRLRCSRWPITHAGFAACLARHVEDQTRAPSAPQP